MRHENAAAHCALRALAALIALSLPVLASDPPDAQVNPQTGTIETADSAADTGVRHVVNPGRGRALEVTIVSDNPLDAGGPKLAVSGAGNTLVTWWRAGAKGQILVRKRTLLSRAWSPEVLVSDPGEDSRSPSIAHDGTRGWIAYSIVEPGATAIAVTADPDSPDPMPGRRIIAHSTVAAPVEVQIQAEAGHLWVTWVESGMNIGWAEYDYASKLWSIAHFESYAADSAGAARERVRLAVTAKQ